MMKLDVTNFLFILLGAILVLSFILLVLNDSKTTSPTSTPSITVLEKFDPLIDSIDSEIEKLKDDPTKIQDLSRTLADRLAKYGVYPNMSNYVTKTELGTDSGKCVVANAEDRDKYIAKSDVPAPGPRIDLSQYVKKSSIPPEKVCPTPSEVDLSAYVKKSTLQPPEKCPPCIAPKVKVSAGLCRECPPAPSCPPPQRCPEVKCPACKPCPVPKKCAKCSEVKYIKVPTIITKTVVVDQDGNLVSQKVSNGEDSNGNDFSLSNMIGNVFSSNTSSGSTTTTQPSTVEEESTPTISNKNEMPSTTFPSSKSNGYCPNAVLNSDFKQYGIYGP